MLAQQIGELRQDEGSDLVVYDDATGEVLRPGYTLKGHPTIGIGRCLDTHGISVAEQEMLLQNDLVRVTLELSQYAWYAPLSDVRKGVVENMAFQMGSTGVNDFHNMIACIINEDWQGAGAQMKQSAWYLQTQRTRTDRLIRQMMSGAL